MPADRYPLSLGLEIASLATVIAAVAGVWLSRALLREFPGKRTLDALATAAIALPAPLLCYYLLAVRGRVWPLTRAGLVAAGVLSAAPLLVRSARVAFASLQPAYGNAARSLGASEWRVFARIELPLAIRALLAAIALVFARLVAELAAAFWLADPRV
ncbi:MAG: ABC transporter permease subunit [Acidobacteriia bacterium]|nr:ABC transporter permease subunit [Terriglobia bacterium]